MSWQLRRLDELGSVSRGRSRHRPRDAAHLYGGPHPFIQTGDVKHAGLYITDYTQTYSDAGLEQSKLWPAGTLCITIAANIADTAILGIDACFPDSVIGFKADPHHADARFVKYLFDATIKRRAQQFSQGATQDNLSQEKLLSLEFNIPWVDEQTRIADMLSAYDDLIENNRRRMALLEESARLLYREWFVRLRFPGHEHTRIIDGVPVGWGRKSLGELANITMGQSPESKFYNETGEGLPFHQGVADFCDRFVKHRIYCSVQNRIAEAGDILCSVRAPVGRLNITMDKVVIGRGLAALRSKTGNQSLLFQQLRAHFFKEDLIGAGAIFASVTKKEFEAQKILNPTVPLTTAFEEVTSQIDEQLRVLTLQNQKLRTARDLLLPRLMSGEIAV
ncbi:MAG: restriction endonuclease subunit S [Gammaproteobacteria bacterium]|nr:restriction endonuclease subunit S [Gammaproteobacteria bacterium]